MIILVTGNLYLACICNRFVGLIHIYSGVTRFCQEGVRLKRKCNYAREPGDRAPSERSERRGWRVWARLSPLPRCGGFLCENCVIWRIIQRVFLIYAWRHFYWVLSTKCHMEISDIHCMKRENIGYSSLYRRFVIPTVRLIRRFVIPKGSFIPEGPLFRKFVNPKMK